MATNRAFALDLSWRTRQRRAGGGGGDRSVRSTGGSRGMRRGGGEGGTAVDWGQQEDESVWAAARGKRNHPHDVGGNRAENHSGACEWARVWNSYSIPRV
jgi:hypothetical protein